MNAKTLELFTQIGEIISLKVDTLSAPLPTSHYLHYILFGDRGRDRTTSTRETCTKGDPPPRGDDDDTNT